ncbi:MAG TPA: TolC family protein [Terriglobia bacterium]|nr:TolC family protein [Terriglobia bacterium]
MYSYVLFALLAANPITLAQIDSEVLAHNPDIESVRSQKRIAEAHLGNAMTSDDPQFSYRAWGTPLLQPWNLNQTQHMFMFTESVPSRSKRELQFLIASDETEIQAMAVEAKKREVIALAHQAFNQLLRSYDQLRIHHDEVTLAQQSIEATRIQYTAGKALQPDVLKAGVAYSRLAEHEITLERDADSARAELNTLMGRPPDQPLEVEGSYGILETLPTQEALRSLAVANRPELLELDLMTKQSARKVELARKGLNPDYSVTAGYMLMPSGSSNRNGWMGEVSMTLPWLNRSKHDSEIQQAREEHDAILAEYQKQLSSISREIREALIRAQSALKIVELYRDTLRPDTASVSKAATVAYQTNQSSLLSVLDTRTMSIEVEYALFDALSNYEQSLADMERAVGASVPGERKPL